MRGKVWLIFLAGALGAIPWLGGEVLELLPPIRRVEVEGRLAGPVEEAKRRLRPLLQGKTLLEVDLEELAAHLTSHPMIKACELWMVPPDGLKVRIVERQPVARLQCRGETFLVDGDGTTFPDTGWGAPLPLLQGISPGDRGGLLQALGVLRRFEGSPLGEVETLEFRGGLYWIRTSRQLLVRMDLGGGEQAVRSLERVWRFLRSEGKVPRYLLSEGPHRVWAGLEGEMP